MLKDETFNNITCRSLTVENTRGDSIRLSIDNENPMIHLTPANGTRVYFSVDKEIRIIYGFEGGKREYRLPRTPDFVR